MAITEKYVSGAGGGAHDGSTPSDAFSWTEMVTDINAGGKAGNRYNFTGSVSRTTNTDTITGDGTSTSPIIIRGYNAVIGDGYLGRTGGNGALITTNMPTVTYTTGRLNGGGGDWIIYETLNISGAPSNPVLSHGATCVVKSCVIVNSGTNSLSGGISTGGANGIIIDNDVSLTGASGGAAAIQISQANMRILANRIKGGPAIGITTANAGAIVDNLIFASVGLGIAVTGTGATILIYGNTIVGGTTDGVDIVTGTTVLQCVANNMLTDNGGFGVDGVSAANAIFVAYNRTRDNSAAYNSATDWIAATKYGDVTTDSGGPETDYTASGSFDYSLIANSPAKGTGLQPYRDIGALQRQEPVPSPTTPAAHVPAPIVSGWV